MKPISVDLIDAVTPMAQERLRQARRLPHLRYADLRLEITEAKGAGAENGTPKFSGDDYGFALGVRVLAGDRMIAPGYVGQVLGTADVPDLDQILKDALERARSEEHTSELQSPCNLVCRLLLEKKKNQPRQLRLLLHRSHT